MGRRSNLTQSHYNKIEKMSKIMSYDSLVVLHRAGLSADFLITGITQKNTVINELLTECNEKDRADFLHAAVIFIKVGIRYQKTEDENVWKISKKEIEILRLDMENKDETNYSIWKSIRTIDDMTQEKISEILEIDVKTYREIEKGKSKPNAEILATLYEKLDYPPSLMMDMEDKNYLFAINEIWLRLSEDLQQKIEKEMRGFLKYIDTIRQ
jgi:transcriptional regulator with XRE-family HTH domain